jgi:hypothetical protein
MTLISRQPRVESGVQVITVSDYLNRRLRDDHIPPSVNRVAVRIVDHCENVADYDARIPSSVSRISGQQVHRESLVIQADYDAHIPPSVIRIQCRQSIEIQAEYDAHIPPRLDRLDASTLHNQAEYDAHIPLHQDRLHHTPLQKQAQYEPQSPPNFTNFSVHFYTAFKRHIPLTFLQKRLAF